MKKNISHLKYTIPFVISLSFGCGEIQKSHNQELEEVSAIEHAILSDRESFYYIDTEAYQIDADLPIGFFDSGTGGLTILNSVMESDKFHNQSHELDADGILDFESEKFIYLADQANMPYGNYYAANNSELLLEHIIKDAQFLLAKKFYVEQKADEVKQSKEPIKAMVIACNTATAYGKESLVDFMQKANIPLKVIGVIDAGAKGALEKFEENEDGSIAVFATVGTIASKGYENTIMKYKEEMGVQGDIQVFNQGGHGLAEAVDQEADYISSTSQNPRGNYRGPSLEHPDFPIHKTLLDVYNFDFDHGKMLCDNSNIDDCDIMQINSTENYVRYHLVSMMEKIKSSQNPQPLKVILLGCTHYPYLQSEMRKVIAELYDFKDADGYRYRDLMDEDIQMVDPADNVAIELYQFLADNDLLSKKGDFSKSEFYISVPNLDNPNVKVENSLNFTYEYKYGRIAEEIQEYVKVVPFSKENIAEDTYQRLEQSVPTVFQAIRSFHQKNEKLVDLSPASMLP
ncbi:Asp/Glu/hydantoin racemase [Belliella sp. DSM 111904]|uniref:Asp/Glu/hydantoin racemase n=1 Tax=Belliella filtrata TaxID=2923435 RepID=A0ABS9UX67_9BACT|nr:Asp/Glu/hydantoin racemase [Belliella filtrata]MCH7408737.1 Asp/Glu/hydantoin racemase [Belliella filtrata]